MNKFFQFGKIYALSRGYLEENLGANELVTNSDWLDGMSLIEFLATVGRHVRVSQMLSRERCALASSRWTPSDGI